MKPFCTDMTFLNETRDYTVSIDFEENQFDSINGPTINFNA